MKRWVCEKNTALRALLFTGHSLPKEDTVIMNNPQAAVAFFAAGALVFAGAPAASFESSASLSPPWPLPIVRIVEPSVENTRTPEKSRHPLPTEETLSDRATEKGTGDASLFSLSASAPVGTNLVPNSQLEIEGANGLPASWRKGGYGQNVRTLAYGAPGASGRGIQTSVSSYQSGDAKWYFEHVPIDSSTSYRFSDAYASDAPSIVTVQFRMSNGSFIYKDVAFLEKSAAFTRSSAEFTPPPGAVSLTVFHLLKTNGTLTTDDYSLSETPPDGNYIVNGDFESGGSAPSPWKQGGWGNNTRTFSYPVPGIRGNAAQVSIGNYVSGDAKWYFEAIPLPPGDYAYEDDYQAGVPSHITVGIQRADGSFAYTDIAHREAAPEWTHTSALFSVPATASGVTVFHLIKQPGALTIDNAVIKSASRPGIFATGAVTLRFDDNWRSQYEHAFPKLDAAGLKATLYVVSQQIFDTGFLGYMSRAEIQDIASRGYEIGAHTRTHPNLATLSVIEQQSEIQGSLDDLLAWNVGSVKSFAYPFGSYTAETLRIVKDAGFRSAASSNGGSVTIASDPYQLERRPVEASTTFAQIQQWIDDAIAAKQWLILSIHQVEPSCPDRYCVPKSVFDQTVDYLTEEKTPVVTVSAALDSL